MTGTIVGYLRVSTSDQNADRQLQGVEVARLFSDTASGRDADRPQLEQMLLYVRAGDTVVVHSMDRLARNLLDLRLIVQRLTAKGVRVRFIKEALTFSDEQDSPIATLLLSVMGAFAEFERALIRERQAEGIALAKKNGVYKGRRSALSTQQRTELRQRAAGSESKASLARAFGVSRETVYQYLRDDPENST